MMASLLALVWLGAISIALAAYAVFERQARLFARSDRPEMRPPIEAWGHVRRPPASASLLARGAADFARIVRADNRVEGARPGLTRLGRIGILSSLAAGLALVPFAGSWGGAADGAALVALDAEYGLLALGLILGVATLSRVALSLAESSPWSRMAAVRQASHGIAAFTLLSLVVAPIAIDADSLRLHEIVLDQQRPLTIFSALSSLLPATDFEGLRAWSIPAWNLWTQPLTAILFALTLSLLLRNPRVDQPETGSVRLTGLGLDSDPVDRYWTKLDTRLSVVFSSALFVALFLGAGSIPFTDTSLIVSRLAPFVGEGLSSAVVAAVHLSVFLAKWLVVLGLSAHLKRVVAEARNDRVLRFATRRLLPLAWANLLLVAGVSLWFTSRAGDL